MEAIGNVIAGGIAIDTIGFGKQHSIAKQSNECERDCVEVVGMQVVPESPKMPSKEQTQSDRTYEYMLNLQNKLAQSLKRSEQEQEQQNYESDLKQLIRVFCCNTDEQEHSQLRITLSCINLLALLLFHKGKELFKKVDPVLLKKFVGRVSSLDIETVLQANPRIESSVVYLLTLIKLLPDAVQSASSKKYKNNILQFLRYCGSSDKISYNILKLIFDLQKKQLFEEKDFQRYRVVQLITERVRGQSTEMQVIAYNILLKMGKTSAALTVFEEALAVSTDRNTTITRFLTALTCYPELIGIDTYHYFNRLFRQSGVNPPLYYFKLVGCVISKLPLEQYIEFLESTLMQHLDDRWPEVRSASMQLCYFELYLSVLRIGRDLPIFSLLLSKFALTGFQNNFVEAVRNCQCRQLYGVLRHLYLEFLRGRVPDTLN